MACMLYIKSKYPPCFRTPDLDPTLLLDQTLIRQNTCNPILRWFGPELTSFDESCRRLIAAFNNSLPEGSLKARIRCTTRESQNVKDGMLSDTLGQEAEAMVMIDFQGHPIRYDELGVYEEIVAEDRTRCRLDLQVQTEDSRGGWRHVASTTLDPGQHSWRANLRHGAQQLQDLHVKASDPHYSPPVR